MFDSLKKTFGIKDNKPTSTGHILGTGKKENSQEINTQDDTLHLGSSEDSYTFDVTFVDEKIGMGVDDYMCSDKRSRPIVSTVSAGSPAHKAGVLQGDVIIALENNPLSDFNSFFTFMNVIGRPVTVT